MSALHPGSILFVTLDSCRFDSFAAAAAPHLKAVAPLRRAQAPSHFTYGSHAAMFAGFTPSLPGAALPFLDAKFSKLFRLGRLHFGPPAPELFELSGASIIAGFNSLGYRSIGSGAVRWFDPATPTGARLVQDFQRFHYTGSTWQLPEQLGWLQAEIDDAASQPVFAFLNVGETHAPYFHEGAAWDRMDNPCKPYQRVDRAAECRQRQIACITYADTQLAPLLARFAAATILVCADHGDCWGEDGLWEHGVSHDMTLSVPLLLRVRGRAV